MKKELLDKVVSLLTDIRSDEGFSSIMNGSEFKGRITDVLLNLSLYESTTTVGDFEGKSGFDGLKYHLDGIIVPIKRVRYVLEAQKKVGDKLVWLHQASFMKGEASRSGRGFCDEVALMEAESFLKARSNDGFVDVRILIER